MIPLLSTGFAWTSTDVGATTKNGVLQQKVMHMKRMMPLLAFLCSLGLILSLPVIQPLLESPEESALRERIQTVNNLMSTVCDHVMDTAAHRRCAFDVRDLRTRVAYGNVLNIDDLTAAVAVIYLP